MEARSHRSSKRSYPKSETARDRPSHQRPKSDSEHPTGFKRDPIIFAGGVLILVILITIVAVAASRANKANSSRIIDSRFIETVTSCGPVRGFIDDGVFTFLGIPYAVPPVKEKRWKQSSIAQSLEDCWNGTRAVLNRSVPCWQFSRDGDIRGRENCLTLDIHTPKISYMNSLPVMVFIGVETLNGGQYRHLQPSNELLRDNGVVFVRVNFRLSVLGFLALDILTKNSYPPSSGNYGLSDIISALKWVQLNIEHFGGDPKMVTLVGHQAGATLATALTGSRKAVGLFRQIWVTGGSGYFLNRTLWEAEKQNEPVLLNTACDTYTCLLELSPEQLLRAVPEKWKWFTLDLPIKGSLQHSWIVSDGEILTGSPLTTWGRGSHPDIPMVIGVNLHQNADNTLYRGLNFSDRAAIVQHLTYRLGTFSPSLVDTILSTYSLYDGNPWQTFNSLLSDVRSICPLHTLASEASRSLSSPVYFYIARQSRDSPVGGHVADGFVDIDAIFGVFTPKSPEERQFVDNIQRIFYNFIEYGSFERMTSAMPRKLFYIDSELKIAAEHVNCRVWNKSPMYHQVGRLD